MRQQLLFSFAAVMVAMMVFPTGAGAQAVSLQEQLAAQYRLAQIGADSSGWSVAQEGTLLVIQKGGIVGIPYNNMIVVPVIYENGNVRSISPQAAHTKDAIDKICKWFPTKCPTIPDPISGETTSTLFKVGDRVYPTRIDVNVNNDKVTMGLVACDACNKTNPPTANKAQVVFQFAKGSLAKTSAGDVEDTIGQLLSIATDDQRADGGHQEQQGTQPGQDQQQVIAQRPRPTLRDSPPSIELKGMTPDQVEAALGTPEKKITLETKQIYVYKDMKVIFLNGQVSDVE